MAFPFFNLPLEVRNIIYTLLFVTRNEDKMVIPDPIRTRRQNGLGAQTLNLKSLSFLRTCQLAHEEATAMLYGIHTFYFSDEPHHGEKLKLVGLDVSIACCDYTSMYKFLILIKERNRVKLRHLHLGFSVIDYMLYPEEESAYRVQLVHSTGYGGATLLGNALELLSERQALQTLTVSFFTGLSRSPFRDRTSAMFQLCGTPCKLVRRLEQIRGLQEFKIVLSGDKSEPEDDILSEGWEYARDNISRWTLQTKVKVEAGSATASENKPTSRMTVFGFKSEPKAQGKTPNDGDGTLASSSQFNVMSPGS